MAKPNRKKMETITPPATRWGIKFKPREFEFTKKQRQLLALLESEDVKICFILGPAGVSKTMMAAYAALQLLQKDRDKSILYLRSIVESSSRSMGFLPGEKEDKMAPYLTPLEDKLEELIHPGDVAYLKTQHIIEGAPINFLRGSNWRDKIIVADEAQNYSFKEFLTIMTRLAEGSKMFICGDPNQSDIRDSGLIDVYNKFNNEDAQAHGIYCFQFTEEDIVRSAVVKYIVENFKDFPCPQV